MDAAEAKRAFIAKAPIIWKDLLTEKETEYPFITALTYRYIRGEDKPILQIEVLDKAGCTMILHPNQVKRKKS